MFEPPLVQHLSLWLFAPLLALVLMAAHEAGVQLRRFNTRRAEARGAAEDDDTLAGYSGAIMGLMALLVGFTFGMALERYNTRRNLVIEETVAIGEHYRRLLTLPEPQRTRLADVLIRYLDSREAFSQAHDDRAMRATETRSELAGGRLWLDSVEALTGPEAPSESGSVLDATETMLRAAVMRREVFEARVPINVVRAMLAYAVIASGFIGYAARKGRRLFLPSTVQLALLALAIALILDLDTARTGVVVVDEGPLVRMDERIRGFETGRRRAQSLAPPPARAAER